jgi:hypothetical protein
VRKAKKNKVTNTVRNKSKETANDENKSKEKQSGEKQRKDISKKQTKTRRECETWQETRGQIEDEKDASRSQNIRPRIAPIDGETPLKDRQ